MGAGGKGNAKKVEKGVVAGVSWNKPWLPDSQMPGSSLFMCDKLPEVTMESKEAADSLSIELIEIERPSFAGRVIYAAANVIWMAAWRLELVARRLEALGGRYA